MTQSNNELTHSKQIQLSENRKVRRSTAAMVAAIMAGTGSAAWALLEKPSSPKSGYVAPVGTGSYAELVEHVKPAVVNISVIGERMATIPSTPGFPYQKYFGQGRDPNSQNQSHQRPSQEFQAVGSGFIVDPDGYVVTNSHVIGKGDQVTVILNKGKRYPAKVVGKDSKLDLALLKIEVDEALPYVEFGDSDRARTGDRVLAIGNPFGLGGTVTTGIISARGRDIQSGPYDDYIQVDAPINQGNSGGPLFNMSGQVVGINTAIFSPNGGNVGIGFSIPSKQAEPILRQLREQGYVERSWLGVQIQGLTPELAESLGLKNETGALVSNVVADSPAAEAGVQVGDVILSFDSTEIIETKDLTKIVAGSARSTKTKLQVWRNGKAHPLNVSLKKMKNSGVIALDQEKPEVERGKLGLALASLTPEARQRYRLANDVRGVLIVDVRPDSPAGRQGLRPGDVISRVGLNEINDPADVAKGLKEVEENEKNSILVMINRGGNERFIALDLV